MARALAVAPRRVGIAHADDGWAAACLAVAGRVPVWACEHDSRRATAVLARLGLPPLGTGRVDARLGADLALAGPPASAPLPAVSGPLVTILVCTYNRADLVQGAIRSALAQSWPVEVVVVDDGSTDGTWELLSQMEGIRAFRQPNGGKPVALARGLAEARGEAVLVLDDDDLLLPGAIQVLAHPLFSRPELACVVGDTIVFDGATGQPTSVVPALRVPGARTLECVLQQIPAMPGAMLVRMSAQRAAGDYDPGMVRGQDMDMALRLARVGPFEAVPLPTFLYRSHDGLRGSAADRWHKSDRAAHDARFLAYVQPVFARRYAEASPVYDRAEGLAWAVGLWRRGLREEGRREAARWHGTDARTAWVRTQVGLPARQEAAAEAVLVVDDGDPGALEETLHRHAEGRDVFVDLVVPRDPLGNVRLFWPGTYEARERLDRMIRDDVAVHVRWSSAPAWAPPPVRRADLPQLDPVSAVVALMAALGWTEPDRPRAGLPITLHPVAARCLAARRAVGSNAAMSLISPLLESWPTWRPGWTLAADAFAALGLAGEAQACRSRAA